MLLNAIAALLLLAPPPLPGADLGNLNLAKQPTIEPPSAEQVREVALAWLADRNPDEPTRQAAEKIWQDGGGPSVLDRLAQTFALADERASSLVALCSRPRTKGPLAPQEWLKADDLPALERDNLRLLYGQWLTQQRYYDEALGQLAGLEAKRVVDPASLLFYQGVVYHRLLDREHGLKVIEELLANVAGVPRRYRSVAELMKSDLTALKDESLDHISRQMEDIHRRLGLGRAGKKVRQVEDDVIAALDKMIEEAEKRQQQQQANSAPAGGAAPSQAMPDSRIARMQGKGEVDRRRLGNTSGWGDLPPKQREEALQQIGKEFPSHYRDAVEQYFRKLAAESEE
ncbi:MAG: hypothetical protein ACREJM_15910 [Candidatus Saccharimonadales bacterium]